MSDTVPSKDKSSVFAAITMRIVTAIEAGAGEYRCPWHTTGAPVSLPSNAVTLAEYRGVNVLALWVDAMTKGFSTGVWASYKQWQSVGAQVREGQRGSMIVFYKRHDITPQERDDPDRQPGLKFFARPSWVFNAAQVDGYTPHEAEPPKSEFERCREVEAFVDAIAPNIGHGFPMACYRPSGDTIEMPARETFVGTSTSSPTETYYSVLLHELTHWTGSSHRLNRNFGRRFGDEAYAMEELVAELGAAFACSALGITSEPHPDHAAYISAWLALLKRDTRAVFTAASDAQDAFEHLCYLATRSEPVAASG